MGASNGQIAVVGAGVIGTLCAIRLRDAGWAVTLFDAGTLAGAASARAAGMLATISEAAAPSRWVDALVAGRAAYPALAAEIATCGVDIGYHTRGTLQVARDAAEADALHARAAFNLACGWASETLSADLVAAREPALAGVPAGLYYPDEHQVDPVALLQGLHALWLAGGGVMERATVHRVVTTPAGRATGLEVASRTVPFSAIVLASGSWTPQLCPSEAIFGTRVAPNWVRPVRGQLLEFVAPPRLLREVVQCDAGYMLPRYDGRVIVGSTLEDVGFDVRTTTVARQTLTAWATRLCPALAALPVAHHWSGLRPRSLDDRPLVGKTATEGLLVATGHFRNGIVMAPHTAAQIVALASGQTTADDRLFSPLRFSEGQHPVSEIDATH